MRKIIVIISILSICLVACGNNSVATTSSIEAQAAESATESTSETTTQESVTKVLPEESPIDSEKNTSSSSSEELDIATSEEGSAEEVSVESATTFAIGPSSVDPAEFYSADGTEFDFDAYLIALGYKFLYFDRWAGHANCYAYDKPDQRMYLICDAYGATVDFEKDGLFYYATFNTEKEATIRLNANDVVVNVEADLATAIISIAKYFAETSTDNIDPVHLPTSAEYGGMAFSVPFTIDGEPPVTPDIKYKVLIYSTRRGGIVEYD